MKVSDSISVDFHHNPKKRKSACIITINDQQFVGKAKCHEDDEWRRPIARRLTLARAMKATTLDRNGRLSIWNALRDKGVRFAI